MLKHDTQKILGPPPLPPLPPLPMDAAELVPQRTPMRVVTRLLLVAPPHARAECRLDASSPFVAADGAILPVAFIEMAAQACAAVQGYALLSGAPAREGFLVGIKNCVISGTARSGQPIVVDITEVAELDGFYLADTVVSLAESGVELARLRLKTYCPQLL